MLTSSLRGNMYSNPAISAISTVKVKKYGREMDIVGLNFGKVSYNSRLKPIVRLRQIVRQ